MCKYVRVKCSTVVNPPFRWQDNLHAAVLRHRSPALSLAHCLGWESVCWFGRQITTLIAYTYIYRYIAKHICVCASLPLWL